MNPPIHQPPARWRALPQAAGYKPYQYKHYLLGLGGAAAAVDAERAEVDPTSYCIHVGAVHVDKATNNMNLFRDLFKRR